MAEMEKPEWFRVYPAQFLSDGQVDAMSTVELGACFRLLCRQWLDGFIPDDLAQLARLCRLDARAMAEAWQTLQHFFPEIEPGKRANRYMWVERTKVMADFERRSDEGRRAARKRWDEKKELNATPNGSPMPHPMQTRLDRTIKTSSSKPAVSPDDPVLELKLQERDSRPELFPRPPQSENGRGAARGERDLDRAVRQIFDYYLERLGKNVKLYKFDAERKQKGIARLKECLELAADPKLENAIAMMKLCVDRLAESAFHNGNNDNRKKYVDWGKHLFHSRHKLEWWLDDDNHNARVKAVSA
jgi:uncharacterized protein YdaU (DUF1376 family)